jgi:hypothetical protein
VRALLCRRLSDRAAALRQVIVGRFTGDKHPPGMPTPSLPSLLYEIEPPNPNLKLFGDLYSDLIYYFL